MSTKYDGSKKSISTSKKPTSKTLSHKKETSSEKSNSKTKDLQEKVPSKKVLEEKNGTVNSSKTKQLEATSTKSTQESKKISSRPKKDMSNRDVPLTPPSNRVKKSQYFPTKNLYSNALKSADIQSKLLAISEKNASEAPKIRKRQESEKTRTKVIAGTKTIKDKEKTTENAKRKLDVKKESERKSLHVEQKPFSRNSSPDSSSISERPRTATLRKGSIVNANIVGPEAPLSVRKTVPETISTIKEIHASPVPSDDYEDDFESYESDFEAYSSSEEDYQGTTSSSAGDVSDTDPLPQTQTEIKRVSSAGTDEERKLDSGTFELPEFKHIQILEHIKENLEKESSNISKERTNMASLSDEGFEDQKSLQFINFADAKKRFDQRKVSLIRKKRGEEILSMIKLDTVNFTLLKLKGIPYDEYIRHYGQSNTVQTSSQTGDEDLSEETQTDFVKVETKWTQAPIKFSSLKNYSDSFWKRYTEEYFGVGDDDDVGNVNQNFPKDLNENRLNLFITKATDVISELLMQEDLNSLDNILQNERNVPFSDGYLEFDVSEKILENTSVVNVSIFSGNIKKILTIHVRSRAKSVICVWDISSLDRPLVVLTSYGDISCGAFSSRDWNHIFAGQQNGTILVWDVKEKTKNYNMLSGTPTLSTLIGTGHLSKVVSIQSTNKNRNIETESSSEFYSLDEEGIIIVWNLRSDSDIRKSTSDLNLIKIATINLQIQYPEMPDMTCVDLLVEGGHAFISTNYGHILHYSLDESKNNTEKISSDSSSKPTCLEQCPFSTQYFIAGCDNGNVNLYSRNSEKSLIVLRNNDEIDNNSIQIVRWSTSKPFVLYAKDSKDTIHIWDLSKSDMFPEYSIPFKERISCLKLSPIIDTDNQQLTYMIIGTAEGKIYLHLLNKDYGQQDSAIYKNNMKTFLNYVCRL